MTKPFFLNNCLTKNKSFVFKAFLGLAYSEMQDKPA